MISKELEQELKENGLTYTFYATYLDIETKNASVTYFKDGEEIHLGYDECVTIKEMELIIKLAKGWQDDTKTK